MNRHDVARRIQNETGIRVEWNPIGTGNGEYIVAGIIAGHYAHEARRMARRVKKEQAYVQ